jgi:hypothetical protein
MNETSGTRSDSTGLNALTDNNTVAASAGKIGNAADFVAANTEFLSVIFSAGSLTGGDQDFTFSLWVKTSAAVTSCIITDGPGDYALYISSAGAFRWEMFNFGWEAQSAVGFNNGTWHHVICWHTASTGILSIAVDDGSAVNSGVVGSYASGTNFFIGANQGASEWFTGSVDEIGRWSRVLTPAERTSLYNSGTGITYPFVGT